MSLLLIEDDELLARTLEKLLRQYDETEVIGDGHLACQRLAQTTSCALVILDLNLPGRSGLEALAALRRHDSKTPVLILTARASVEDRVAGLDGGADDYLTKPFSLSEFEARVRALLRRQRSTVAEYVTMGGLSLHLPTQRLQLGDAPLSLPPREQRLLSCLLRHGNRVISRMRLIEEAFGSDEEMRDNALEVQIHRLRRRLEESDVQIRTIRGMGYRLEQR
ncbi:response regulator transcription factor [Kushneria aurantia]|uniref:Response regulator transcription factor n=1 Tax=Kushneria aurantia TaxID=504092 RepID=A0ABV6G820_9GAMM|nr:response regulator transcription factor [Kushneria aurantia]